MAITITTTNQYSDTLRTFYEMKFLEGLTTNLVFYNFATEYPIAKGFGPVVQFTRYTPSVSTPADRLLSEGTPPSSIQLSIEKVNATALQYGNFVDISDWLYANYMSGYSEQVEQTLEVLSLEAQDVIDQIVRNGLGASSGANSTFAGSATSVATLNPTSDLISADQVRKVVRTLKRRFVPFFDGSNYIGIISPGQSFDLQGESGVGSWIDVNKYTGTTKAEKGEIGKLYSVRFVESQNLTVAGGVGVGASGTVQSYFFGKDALGVVNVKDVTSGNRKSMKHIELFIKEPGSAGTADPLNQHGTIGYKFNIAAVRLHNSRVQLFESGEGA